MDDVRITVNDEPVEVPEECTVAEIRSKAKLPANRTLYDVAEAKTLDDTAVVRNHPGKAYGAVEPWTLG